VALTVQFLFLLQTPLVEIKNGEHLWIGQSMKPLNFFHDTHFSDFVKRAVVRIVPVKRTAYGQVKDLLLQEMPVGANKQGSSAHNPTLLSCHPGVK
jgi:hypothetical protein